MLTGAARAARNPGATKSRSADVRSYGKASAIISAFRSA